ncbi:transketolase [Parvularcula lutaonensis]|uniref:Transketolase n=1 Tax=Parvularcula lutaonensis TaxID=491923 RepID=A0ABV7M8K0_9PROT|nr:transketolase [Parvularcula lutaonensis]GGY45013.1 transketolase [Parvularcula lutaonensis]
MPLDHIYERMSAAIAALSMDAVEKANSGHPGMPLGMADVATVLFSRHMKFDAAAPDWPDRDRFVLSAGHGSMLQYSLLHLLGFEDMTLEELKNFRQLGAKTAGHPEYGHAKGIETTTGPLGQGLGNAVGFALAEKHLAARFGSDLVDHYTYTIVGDGCLMEGISQEVISFAGHQKLGKLIVLWDDNNISIDGRISLSDSTDQIARFEACGWRTMRVDGHDMEAVDKALTDAKGSDRPVLIACKTVIGKNAGDKAGTSGSHGAPLGSEAIAAARRALGWEYGPFEIPDDVYDAWRSAGSRGASERAVWEERHHGSSHKAAFDEAMAGDVSAAIRALSDHAREAASAAKAVATRKASQNCLDAINAATPLTVGGSADLTGSNNTKTAELGILDAENPGGRYIHYGIREHGMAAIMNGLALHRGVVPYGGTFLVFSDYMRPAMRLSALMEQRVVYVLTHDSIGLGEDGPTHQPVEHLASLRAIPGLYVFRPADEVETAESWAVSLELQAPSVLALTRQSLPAVRADASENLTRKGGYVLRDAEGAKATIVATGSEVEIALAAADNLSGEGIPTRVVSLPCAELFLKQDGDYIADVLGTAPRLGIEAGIQMGWGELLGLGGTRWDFLGMSTFGASGPYKELYEHFGITAKNAAAKVRSLIKGNE